MNSHRRWAPLVTFIFTSWHVDGLVVPVGYNVCGIRAFHKSTSTLTPPRSFILFLLVCLVALYRRIRHSLLRYASLTTTIQSSALIICRCNSEIRLCKMVNFYLLIVVALPLSQAIQLFLTNDDGWDDINIRTFFTYMARYDHELMLCSPKICQWFSALLQNNIS